MGATSEILWIHPLGNAPPLAKKNLPKIDREGRNHPLLSEGFHDWGFWSCEVQEDTGNGPHIWWDIFVGSDDDVIDDDHDSSKLGIIGCGLYPLIIVNTISVTQLMMLMKITMLLVSLCTKVLQQYFNWFALTVHVINHNDSKKQRLWFSKYVLLYEEDTARGVGIFIFTAFSRFSATLVALHFTPSRSVGCNFKLV